MTEVEPDGPPWVMWIDQEGRSMRGRILSQEGDTSTVRDDHGYPNEWQVETSTLSPCPFTVGRIVEMVERKRLGVVTEVSRKIGVCALFGEPWDTEEGWWIAVRDLRLLSAQEAYKRLIKQLPDLDNNERDQDALLDRLDALWEEMTEDERREVGGSSSPRHGGPR